MLAKILRGGLGGTGPPCSKEVMKNLNKTVYIGGVKLSVFTV